MLWRESQSQKKAGASSPWTANDQRMVGSYAFSSRGPDGPLSSLHSPVFIYDTGRCFPSGLTPSYLTDVLWGWMKLCIQCFQFLEENYLWTFRVLHRYVSDLSFLLTVILVCCFYFLYKTTLKCHGHLRRLSELWTSLLCTWPMQGELFLGPQRMSPLQLTRWSRTQVSWACIRIQVRMAPLDASAPPEEGLWLSHPGVSQE